MNKNITVINTYYKSNKLISDIVLMINLIIDYTDKINIIPDDNNPLDIKSTHIIISGIPTLKYFSLTHNKYEAAMENACDWLKDVPDNVKVLGICYGHEIIAQMFNGEISKLEEAVVGDKTLRLNRIGIFSNFPEYIKTFAFHSDYISKMPKDYINLTPEEKIPYIICNSKQNIYGVQFHPEKSGDIGLKLFENFLR